MDFIGGDLEAIGLKSLASQNNNFINKWNETHAVNKHKTDTGYLELLPYV